MMGENTANSTMNYTINLKMLSLQTHPLLLHYETLSLKTTCNCLIIITIHQNTLEEMFFISTCLLATDFERVCGEAVV